jgi:hypothetical protein
MNIYKAGNIKEFFTGFFSRFWKKTKVLSYWLINGYCQESQWSLDFTLSKIILRRLKAFREMERFGYPYPYSSIEEWDEVLDELIEGFEELTDDEQMYFIEGDDRAKEVLELFFKHFNNLWD